jgi:competence protein ComEA
VDVAGAVRRPGVYRLATGTRVHEAITAAGGTTRDADASSLNRAAAVVDGEQILVPARTAAPAPSGSAPGAKVSINTADVAALDQLPGIGPVTAQRIVDDRTRNGPFASVDDLDRVSGIGRATLEQLAGVATT